MLNGRKILDAAAGYLQRNPDEVARFVRSSLGLRFGVPIAAFRWLIENLVKDVAALDPEITAVPPGLRVGVTFEKMETRLRFNATLFVSRIDVSADQILVELRMEGVNLRVLSEKKTIVSALLKSGALDISQIGNLVNELPGLPPVIASAKGNRLVFDVLRSPQLDNDVVRSLVAVWSSLITVDGVQTDDDHLDVVFRALPRGVRAPASAVRRHVVRPGVRQIRSLLGDGNQQALVTY